MTALTMFNWKRLWNRSGSEENVPRAAAEAARAQEREQPSLETTQIVFNVFVYFSRKRSARKALKKTADATVVPLDVVADIVKMHKSR